MIIEKILNTNEDKKYQNKVITISKDDRSMINFILILIDKNKSPNYASLTISHLLLFRAE